MRAVALAAIFVGACGGSSGVSAPNTAAVSGKVDGAPFVALSVSARFAANTLTISLRDYADACTAAPGIGHGFDFAAVDLSSAGSTETAVGGVYTVESSGSNARYATAAYEMLVDGIVDTADKATSGAIDITHNVVGDLRGTFDVTLASGASLSGSFDAIACAGS